MASKTETVHDGEFLISEANGHQSREEVTVVSGQNLVGGAVVGKITASGKYKIYDNAAVDGSEVAAAVLFGAVDASGGDKKGVIIERDAEVNADLLNWGANDATGKTAGIADLLTKGIKVR